MPSIQHPETGKFLSEGAQDCNGNANSAHRTDNSIFTITQPLKSMLRAIHRLMQASGGTEGLRNLVDSELPKSVMRILDEPTVYGSRIFALGKSPAFEHHDMLMSSCKCDGHIRVQRANFFGGTAGAAFA